MPSLWCSPTAKAGALGFTLLELLVVLVLLGIIAVLVAPGLGGSLASAKLKTESRALIAELRVLRGAAITEGKIITLSFADGQSFYRVDGASVQLEEGMKLVFHVADDGGSGTDLSGLPTPQSMPDIGNQRLAFYPDGSSSGAVLELSLAENVHYIHVAWLSGEVSLAEQAQSERLVEAPLP